MAARATEKAVGRTATPWGTAAVVDEVSVRQQAGERRFASVVQLLETADGERLVRFAYSTGGIARRGPVTLRERDVARLRELLEKHPELGAAVRL
ncbi:MAG TPA: hypothetical protein VFA56_12450 [Gaiellaceae bacterium]|nr:hypothetical protein [Gaiellaceae bacterium]